MGLHSSEGSPRTGVSVFKMVRMIGNLGLAVGRRPQFFSTCHPMELLDMANDMVAGFPLGEQFKRKQGRGHSIF